MARTYQDSQYCTKCSEWKWGTGKIYCSDCRYRLRHGPRSYNKYEN